MIMLITGPMFSSKTTSLLNKLERAMYAKKNAIILRPKTDNRDFLTHSRISPKVEEVFVENLLTFDYSNYDVIGVDEGQFHKNLYQFCLNASLNGKTVIVSALHATSECEMFEEIVRLIPYCQEIHKLNAICTKCGSEYGSYTKLVSGTKTEKILVGGSDKFTALCEKCYFENTSLIDIS